MPNRTPTASRPCRPRLAIQPLKIQGRTPVTSSPQIKKEGNPDWVPLFHPLPLPLPAGLFLDRGSDCAAPFGPGAVVVAHVGIAEQLAQHEPGVSRALADAAVGDHLT